MTRFGIFCMQVVILYRNTHWYKFWHSGNFPWLYVETLNRHSLCLLKPLFCIMLKKRKVAEWQQHNPNNYKAADSFPARSPRCMSYPSLWRLVEISGNVSNVGELPPTFHVAAIQPGLLAFNFWMKFKLNSKMVLPIGESCAVTA